MTTGWRERTRSDSGDDERSGSPEFRSENGRSNEAPPVCSPTLPLSHSPTLPRFLRWLPTALLLALVVLHDRPDLAAYRTRQAAGPFTFSLLNWEVEHLGGRLDGIARALLGQRPAADAADAETIRRYFQSPPAAQVDQRPAAERAIQRLVTDALRADGLAASSPLAGGRPVVFPPVSFTFTEPPQVLIVSPRDRIEVSQYVLLRPSLLPIDRDRLENGVASRGVSTLVTPIGGLSTYPAMVLEASSPQATLASVAHEWVHAYFFFEPLGRGYWSSQDARTINETAAELAGQELGARLARELGLPTEPPASQPSPRQREFNRLLRATRLEVDRLLSLGQVDEAERYMEDRRRLLNERGFGIRRLNQAYFAFYGSYAEGPAGSGPIPGQVRSLRDHSASLGDFLKTIAQVRDEGDLARLAP